MPHLSIEFYSKIKQHLSDLSVFKDKNIDLVATYQEIDEELR